MPKTNDDQAEAPKGHHYARQGLKPVLVALTPDGHERIRRAAELTQQSMQRFINIAADEAAKKLLRKETATEK